MLFNAGGMSFLYPAILNHVLPIVQVDPEDVVMLVLSWHFNAATMCEYSQDEFVKGMTNLRCDSIQKLQQKLAQLRAELQDDRKFKVRISAACRTHVAQRIEQ